MTPRYVATVAIAGLLFVFSSCRKTDDRFEKGTKGRPNLSAQLRQLDYFNDYPEVSDGMLRFRDEAHFDAYVNFLDSAVRFSPDNQETGTQDPDSILLGIEQSLAFTSLRHITHTAYLQEAEAGWARWEDIPDEHFINSYSTRSLLNANADVWVGDSILHYINKGYAVWVDADSTALLQRYHDLPISATVEEILDVDGHQSGSTLVNMINAAAVVSVAKTTPAPQRILMHNPHFPNQCFEPRKVRLSKIEYQIMSPISGSWGNPLASDFVIEWGDGTVTPLSNQNNSDAENVDHTYTSDGWFTIQIKARTHTTGGTPLAYYGPESFFIDVPGGCHFGVSKDNEVHATIPGSNKMLKGKVYIEQSPSSSSANCKTGAWTKAFRWENNTWKEHRGEAVRAQYEIQRYSGSTSCTPLAFFTHSSTSGNSKTACVEQSVNTRYGWFSMKGVHRLQLSGTFYGHDIPITPCN